MEKIHTHNDYKPKSLQNTQTNQTLSGRQETNPTVEEERKRLAALLD
jgi:hypothetical protein